MHARYTCCLRKKLWSSILWSLFQQILCWFLWAFLWWVISKFPNISCINSEAFRGFRYLYCVAKFLKVARFTRDCSLLKFYAKVQRFYRSRHFMIPHKTERIHVLYESYMFLIHALIIHSPRYFQKILRRRTVNTEQCGIGSNLSVEYIKTFQFHSPCLS